MEACAVPFGRDAVTGARRTHALGFQIAGGLEFRI